MLRYDVEELVKDWLVSGGKRGDFAATVWRQLQTAVSKHLSDLCLGWRDVFGANHADRTTSRRACSAQSVSGGASSRGRVDDGCEDYSEH
jgi:hypothetical protein